MSQPQFKRVRAPKEDGTALIDPPLARIAALVGHNRELGNRHRYDCHGMSLGELAAIARRELLGIAAGYTSEYRDIGDHVPWQSPDAHVVLAGHQPDLFHPGVWFKSFLLSAAAAETSGVAVNLIVDTDTVRTASIRVPVRDGQQAAIENVPFDAPGAVIPFEERGILDRTLFDSFAERVSEAYTSCWKPGHEPNEPLIKELWPAAIAGANLPGARLGLSLAHARHLLEGRLGLQTLEVPLSRVAQTSGFHRFVAHLLAHLPRLHHIYNTALAEYRTLNQVRSHTHPVPALQEEGEWLEAPLLVWTKDRPQRQRAFVRRQQNLLVVSDRRGWQVDLEIAPDAPVDKAVEQLALAEARGIKLRPRALITTMYARLILSDLFIHGIGGAKYDELTDTIICRFFRVEPPAFVTASATFRLPIERPQVTVDDVRQAARRVRDARYRPESLLREKRVKQDRALAPSLEALTAEKREFLGQHDLRRCSPDVFARLDQLNRAMHELLRPVEEELRAEHARLLAQLDHARLLGSREFSFVLFPSKILSARLLDLCKVSS